jgi:hypothetical protein
MCTLLLAILIHASSAQVVTLPVCGDNQAEMSGLSTGKTFAEELTVSARQDNEVKWEPLSINSYEAGQIDVALLLLLLVAWGIASVRLHGSDREK